MTRYRFRFHQPQRGCRQIDIRHQYRARHRWSCSAAPMRPTAVCCSSTPTRKAHASLVTTGRKDYGADDSLYTVLMADRQNAAQTLLNCIVPIDVGCRPARSPASPMLEGAERELMGVAGAPYRLADPLSKIANQYAAIIIDTRPSFSLMTEMGLLAATDAIVPVEPRYLETVGLTSVIQKINDIREGWRHPNLRVSGLLVTKMDTAFGVTTICWRNSKRIRFWASCCSA